MITEDDFVEDKKVLTLYYNKFKYKVNLSLPGIHYFRYVKTKERLIERVEFLLESKFMISIQNIDHPSVVSASNLIDWQIQHESDKNKYMIKIFSDSVFLYSEEIDIIQSFVKSMSNAIEKKLTYSTPLANYDRESLYLKRPKYSHRIYFKNCSCSLEQRKIFKDFIQQYDIAVNPNLNYSLRDQYFLNLHKNLWYIWEYYFVEFNDEKLVTVFQLKFDYLIRKIFTVKKR